MKQISLFLLFYLTALSFVGAQCDRMDDQYTPRALYKYWQLRERFDQHFVKTDLDEDGNLTGDGIGTWDAANNQYTKAGYSLPVINLLMANRPAQDGSDVYDPPSGTLINSEGAPGVPNVLAVGADNTYAMGMYIAMIASEYKLHRMNGIPTKKLENELFLALQALRRLDMTANQLAAAVCGCDAPFNITPNTSGYTGFMVRLDAPADLHTEFDDPAYPDDWRVGGVRSMFAEADYYEGLPCNFRDEDYRNRIAGQDQIIGMLFGLAFVKKFIPSDLVVSYGGTDYNLLAMAQIFAFHMVNRIASSSHRTIKYPACPLDIFNGGPPRLPNGDGGDATAYYYGMNKLLDYIMPGNGVPSSLGDYLAWQGAITLVVNNDQPIEDNRRMAIELMAASNTNFGTKAKNYAQRCDNLNLMQLFAWAVLHDKDMTYNLPGEMNDILCSLGCEGPCYTRYNKDGDGNPVPAWNGPRFDCSSSTAVDNRWCTGERWKHSCDKVKNCNALTYGEKSSGYDFMLAYNLYHLYQLPNTPFFNPFEVVKDSHEETIDHLTGESSICGGLIPYCIPDAGTSLGEIEWEVSDNLYSPSVGSNTLTCIYVSAANNSSQGTGWIRATFYDGECKYAYQKNVQIGDPDHQINLTISNEPCLYAAYLAIDGQSVVNETYSWTVSAPPGVIVTPTTLNQGYLNVFTNNTYGGVLNYNVAITNECGTDNISGHLMIPEKKCNGDIELFISPNPVDYDMHVELTNVFDDPFKDGGTGQFYLFDQYSNMRRSFDMSSLTKTINVSDLPNGLYFISGQVGGQQITSSQFVIQHSK